MKINNENRNWHLIDVKEQTLGRISTEIANLLRGKNKTEFRPNSDCGDYVVVVNAKEVNLTGKKEDQKRYYKHTGYLGNLKVNTVKGLRVSNPDFIIKHAVSGMLPKNKLRDQFLSRLKIYAGGSHPHQNIKFRNK